MQFMLLRVQLFQDRMMCYFDHKVLEPSGSVHCREQPSCVQSCLDVFIPQIQWQFYRQTDWLAGYGITHCCHDRREHQEPFTNSTASHPRRLQSSPRLPCESRLCCQIHMHAHAVHLLARRYNFYCNRFWNMCLYFSQVWLILTYSGLLSIC